MKLFSDNFDVQVQGAESDSSQFKIAMNAKAFRVLSDTLYQDKIGSMVRETATNAYDAHIMAGTQDIPFEIHLPDNFEPWYSVKDFGVGLSPSDIRKVFCTYFASTKDQSNDTVGAFGLGAKTPFAYTDQFSITSNHNGICTNYSAYIDGNGIPNIAQMHSTETKDRNGVEIRVNVKTGDFGAFRKAVAWQLRFFKVKPIVLNADHFEFDAIVQPTEESIVGTDYVITPYRSELLAIQGQIGYVVDRYTISHSGVCSSTVSALLGTSLSIKIEFPIGDIGVTASRENIEYDANTVANIVAKLESITKDIQDTVDVKLQAADCGWDKIILLSDLYQHFKAGVELKYDNLQKDYRGTYQILTKELGMDVYQAHARYRSMQGKTTYLRYSRSHVTAEKNTVFMLCDTEKPKSEALDKIQAKHPNANMYIVFVQKKTDTAPIKQKLKDYFLGFDCFYDQKDLVEKKVRNTSTVIRPKTTFYNINGSGGWSRAHESDLPEEFVYVEASRGECKNVEDFELIRQFGQLSQLEEFEDEMQLDLIAVPVSEMKKIKDSGGIPLKDFMQKIKSAAPVSQIAAKIRKRQLHDAADAVHVLDGFIRQAVIDSGSSYGKLLASAEKALSKYSSFSAYNQTVAEIFKIKENNLTQRAYAKKIVLKSKHPILKLDTWKLRELDAKELVALLQVQI